MTNEEAQDLVNHYGFEMTASPFHADLAAASRERLIAALIAPSAPASEGEVRTVEYVNNFGATYLAVLLSDGVVSGLPDAQPEQGFWHGQQVRVTRVREGE